MNDKIVKIEFNVWASDESEGEELKKAICGFINLQGAQGRKVSAEKLTSAIRSWDKNPLVRNYITNYFK